MGKVTLESKRITDSNMYSHQLQKNVLYMERMVM